MLSCGRGLTWMVPHCPEASEEAKAPSRTGIPLCPAPPGAAAEAALKGARRAPAISETGHATHARPPRQAAARAPRGPLVCRHSGRPRLPSCNARPRRAHARRAPATRPIQRCALHAGCRCSLSGFAGQLPAGGVWCRPSGTAPSPRRFALVPHINSFPIAGPDGADEWDIECFTAQISVSFRTSRRFLRIPQRLRSWFDPRRLPSAAGCQLSAPLCGGGRGAGGGRRGRAGAADRSRGQVRRGPGRAQRRRRPVGTRLHSVSPCAARAAAAGWGRGRPVPGLTEWARLGVLPSFSRAAGPPCPGCRALSPGRPPWGLGGDLGSGGARFVPRSSPDGVGWTPLPSGSLGLCCFASRASPGRAAVRV